MARRDILDLSHYQSVDDWAAVKAEGVVGVILKASQGTTYRDPEYVGFRGGAEVAGLAVASYHYLEHGKIQEQMEWYLACAAPSPGERVCLDYEEPSCVLSDLHQALEVLATLRPDLQTTIYGGHLLKEQLGSRHDRILAKTSLWIAHYTSKTPSWPSGTWPIWSLWQYADGAAGGDPKNCPGVSVPCDTNEFNGSRENALKWLVGAQAQPPRAVAAIIIEVPSGTQMSINGQDFVAP